VSSKSSLMKPSVSFITRLLLVSEYFYFLVVPLRLVTRPSFLWNHQTMDFCVTCTKGGPTKRFSNG
jgi:hypothetical protein